MRLLHYLATASIIFLLATTSAVHADQNRQLTASLKKPTSGEKRVALVIGNSAYRDKPLRNPVNDARLIGQVVQEAGFELYGGKVHEDLSYAQMMETVEGFGSSLNAGGVAMVFYAGHGMQSGGNNYLIPVDASIKGENELSYKTVNAGLLLAKMEQARSRVNLVVLDACRDNPFARSFRSAAGGLAAMSAPAGTIVAYSTGPGSVAEDGSGKNSIYSESLANALKQKGISIEEAFKQVRSQVRKKTGSKQTPWENTSLEGSFIFIETSGLVTVQAAPAASNAADAEREAWGLIKESTDPADLKDFLEKFPNGQYANTARIKLRQLEKRPSASTSNDHTEHARTQTQKIPPTSEFISDKLNQFHKKVSSTFDSGIFTRNYFNYPLDTVNKIKSIGITDIYIDNSAFHMKDYFIDNLYFYNKTKEIINRHYNFEIKHIKTIDIKNLIYKIDNRIDADIKYNKYFWKGDDLLSYMKDNNVDAILISIFSNYDSNTTIFTSQLLDNNGYIVWEYPNFRGGWGDDFW